MNKNQKGLAAVQAVLIVVIIGILVGVGWYVWNANKQADKNLKSADATAQSVAPAAAKSQHLTINEWGVKFVAPSDLGTLKYTTYGTTGSTPEMVYLSSSELNTASGHTLSCALGGHLQVGLIRYKVGAPSLYSKNKNGAPETKADLDAMIQTYGAKIDDYYYVPNEPLYCNDNAAALKTDKNAQKGHQLELELIKAVNTMQKVQ
jgi:hypothetical protein